jgi:hypothetical protein
MALRPPRGSGDTESRPLIAAESRSHHFGAVISKPGLKLKHAYRLINTSNHDIRIVELVNRQPCCGEVGIGKRVLRPGEATEVEVTLAIRQDFGDIIHDTIVLTDPAEPEESVLRTMARAYAEIRVEELAPANGTSLLSSDKPRLFEFRVYAYGTSREPPIDLDRVELKSAGRVGWAGPKEDGGSDDGVTALTRRFTALLDPAGAPGERNTEILLEHDRRPCCSHVVSWEVVPPIAASPKLIVIKPGQRAYRVLLRSRDRAPFRITGIECKVAGLHGSAASKVAAVTQIVEVENHHALRPQSGRGLITVLIDHPDQQKVDLPFVLLE